MTDPVRRKHRLPRYKPGIPLSTDFVLNQKAPLPLLGVLSNDSFTGEPIIPLPDTAWEKKTSLLRAPQVIFLNFQYAGQPTFTWFYKSDFTPVAPFNAYVSGDQYVTNEVFIGGQCDFHGSFIGGTSFAQLYWNPAYIASRNFQSWDIRNAIESKRPNKTWVIGNSFSTPWVVNDPDTNQFVDFTPGMKFIGTDFLWIQICGIIPGVANDPDFLPFIKALHDGCPNFRIIFYPGDYVIPLIDRSDFIQNLEYLEPFPPPTDFPDCRDSINGVIRYQQGGMDGMAQALRDLGDQLAPYNATVVETGNPTGNDIMKAICDWYGLDLTYSIVDNPDPKYFNLPYITV